MTDLIAFTTFDIATGELLQLMHATDIHLVDLQCDETTDYVFGHWDRATHKVVDGDVVPRDPPEESQP